jgi:hypothetical protein
MHTHTLDRHTRTPSHTQTHTHTHTYLKAAILAVGTTTQRLVPDGGMSYSVTASKPNTFLTFTSPPTDGGYKMASFMTVQLSCDHRVIDGASLEPRPTKHDTRFLASQWLLSHSYTRAAC